MEETVLKPVLHCECILQSSEARKAHICISPISLPSLQTALSANLVKTSDHVKKDPLSVAGRVASTTVMAFTCMTQSVCPTTQANAGAELNQRKQAP